MTSNQIVTVFGVQLCPLPVSELADITRNKVAQNTLAIGAGLHMMGIGFQALEDVLREQFKKKGEAVVAENVGVARAGYDYAAAHFTAFPNPLPKTDNRYAILSGNIAMAMGGVAAGVKFYCAYPMSPSTGVLHRMAAHARKAGIMVRQVEDEIGVINMAIGAAHAGVRAMCATSGGGFALMSEGLGMSAMIETPVVVINCQRAGPSTGVPTKTEQGDLWQMLGAAFGDYPRAIAAPLDIADCFKLIPEMFNVVDRFQCPGLVLCDLLLSEGRLSVHSKDLDFSPPIDRGELITKENGASSGDTANGGYKRYRITESGVSPRAVPGVPGYVHTVATDEHEEDGVLISDEFTNPIKRRAMMEKRMRKVAGMEADNLFPVILRQRKPDGRQIRNPSARDLPDLKTGAGMRGSICSRERRNTWSGFRLAASFRRERCESKLKMQWRWAWIKLVILWSSDRGKPNRLKETNGTHRRSRQEKGGSILRGQRRLPRRMPGGSVLGSRPKSDTF
jgi:2-oxoglutarate ferredoxin oxidoreductase subunit alpha